MKDEAISRCFMSKADVNGRCVRVGVKESTALKRKAVFRGMTAANGKPRKNLSWLEMTVAVMREATTGEDFNHEWWAGEISKPEWVKRLDEYYAESWLYFPSTPQELTPHALGSKVGYILTFNERRLNSAVTDAEFLRKWGAVEVKKAMRGTDPEFEKKTRVVFSGFDSWKDYPPEAEGNTRELRGVIISIAAQKATAGEFVEFMRGFNAGLKRALDDFQSDPMSERNELAEIVEILTDHWPSISDLRDRAKLTAFVLQHFSAARREFLKRDSQPQRFASRMNNICRKIGWKGADRGRPPINGEMSEGG